jgi:hypothetical protein
MASIRVDVARKKQSGFREASVGIRAVNDLIGYEDQPLIPHFALLMQVTLPELAEGAGVVSLHFRERCPKAGPELSLR